MTYFKDAQDLVVHAEGSIGELEARYTESLHEMVIKPELQISIKNLMENLRSALDFAAHGLFDKCGSSSKAAPNIYFPYATASQSIVEFRKAKRIDGCIPGLGASRPDLVTKLESYQWFADVKNEWLPAFMELNNANKHKHLTPQTRNESHQLTVSSQGASMTLGRGASVSIGKGASIQIGGAVLPGGAKHHGQVAPEGNRPCRDPADYVGRLPVL